MAIIGAIRIGSRIGYYAIIPGRCWTDLFVEDNEEAAFLKAVATASWVEYGDYIKRTDELWLEMQKEFFRKSVFNISDGYGLAVRTELDGSFSFGFTDIGGNLADEFWRNLDMTVSQAEAHRLGLASPRS